jgi:hypothetical protein
MQRDTQRDRSQSAAESDAASGPDFEAGFDAGTDRATGSQSEPAREGGSSGLFSVRMFLVLVVVSLVGVVVGGVVPIVGRYLGLFAVAFLAGLATSRRRYIEVGAAGAIASGLTFLLGAVTTAMTPLGAGLLGRLGAGGLAEVGLTVAGIGVGTGLLVSLAGHYLGRDLRDGLTRDV